MSGFARKQAPSSMDFHEILPSSTDLLPPLLVGRQALPNSDDGRRTKGREGARKKGAAEEEEVLGPPVAGKDPGACKMAGCAKPKQSCCLGYCAAHYRSMATLPAQDEREARGPTRVVYMCKAEGCTKYKQSKCDGYCRAHFKEGKSSSSSAAGRVDEGGQTPLVEKRRRASPSSEDLHP